HPRADASARRARRGTGGGRRPRRRGGLRSRTRMRASWSRRRPGAPARRPPPAAPPERPAGRAGRPAPALRTARAGHHRAERRGQDGGAQDGRAVRAHGAGGPLRAGRRGQPPAVLPGRAVGQRRRGVERDISTFTGHAETLAAIAGTAGPGCLVLLDEPGAGTDPVEGAALAVGVLTDLLARGPLLVFTTHFPQVKTFALAEPALEVAA